MCRDFSITGSIDTVRTPLQTTSLYSADDVSCLTGFLYAGVELLCGRSRNNGFLHLFPYQVAAICPDEYSLFNYLDELHNSADKSLYRQQLIASEIWRHFATLQEEQVSQRHKAFSCVATASANLNQLKQRINHL